MLTVRTADGATARTREEWAGDIDHSMALSILNNRCTQVSLKVLWGISATETGKHVARNITTHT